MNHPAQMQKPLLDCFRDLPPDREDLASGNRISIIEWKRSLAQRVDRLLNTRSPLPLLTQTQTGDLEWSPSQNQKLTILHYGIPDLSNFSPDQAAHQELLATVLTQVLQTYEPELHNIQVQVKQLSRTHLKIQLQASVTIQEAQEQIAFSITTDF